MIAIATEKIPPRLDLLTPVREAQQAWSGLGIRQRCRWFRNLRAVLADRALDLARITAETKRRPLRETLTSEIVPLLEACRFLEKAAQRILRPENFRQSRPSCLGGTRFEIQRRPFGVILVIGPQNYPLFLPAVQLLHALAAGNAVCVKPAPGCTAPLRELRELMTAAGLDPALFVLLPEKIEAAAECIRAGVDKVVFTGSSAHGREVLRLLAQTNVPSVMELSGADNVYVRHDAELDRVVDCLAFALPLNAGNTCLVPRAIFAHNAICEELRQRLRRGEIYLPVTAVDDDAEMIALTSEEEFGLGAAIFSRDEMTARQLAETLPTGLVTINDLIVPSADPRIPFGGIRASGFGYTRGAEGLREMTHAHVVTWTRARRLRHLEPPRVGDEEAVAALLQTFHAGGWGRRWRGLWKLMRVGRKTQ